MLKGKIVPSDPGIQDSWTMPWSMMRVDSKSKWIQSNSTFACVLASRRPWQYLLNPECNRNESSFFPFYFQISDPIPQGLLYLTTSCQPGCGQQHGYKSKVKAQLMAPRAGSSWKLQAVKRRVRVDLYHTVKPWSQCWRTSYLGISCPAKGSPHVNISSPALVIPAGRRHKPVGTLTAIPYQTRPFYRMQEGVSPHTGKVAD